MIRWSYSKIFSLISLCLCLSIEVWFDSKKKNEKKKKTDVKAYSRYNMI